MFTRRKLIIYITVIFSMIVVQLLILKSLDYSTSSISWYSVDDFNKETPNPNFQIQNLKWDVTKYSKDSSLEPLRKYFIENCNNLKGIDAASCLSEHFIDAVPFGEPSSEIFNSYFSPSESFQQHISGKPGHCVNYSTMTVDSLLSVNIPARFIQLIPKNKPGHNIIEVWDDKFGWVVFDPLSDSLISDGTTYLSAIEAHESEKPLKRVEAGTENVSKGYLTEYYIGENPFDNAIIYPEPWLYTRIGKKESSFYRGSFIGFGEGAFEISYLQSLLRFGIVVCIVLLLILLAISFKIFSNTKKFS